MNREKEIKNADRSSEFYKPRRTGRDCEVRMAMAKELQKMGLETESIERILSIRINSEK